MAEFITLVLIAALGWLLVARVGVTGTFALALGLPVGTALVVAMQTLLLSTQLPIARPMVALGAAAVCAVLSARSRPPVLPPAGAILVTCGVIAAVTLTTRVVALVNVTSDSFRYLTSAQLLAGTGSTDFMSAHLVHTRGVGTGGLHGLAVGDPVYLTALTPLFGIAILVSLWYVVARPEGKDGRAWMASIAASVAVVLLATNNRFIYNMFYINGHLFTAGWMMLLQVQVWRLIRTRQPAHVDVLFIAVLVTALAATRPEGALLAALTLTPGVLTAEVPRRARISLLGALGAATLIWSVGVLIPVYVADESSTPTSVLGLGVVGLVALVGASTARWWTPHLPRQALIWAHGLVWGALVLLTVRNPRVFNDSIRATYRNLLHGEGGWGITAALLAILFLIVAVTITYEADEALIFTVTTFVPLGVLLALLRGGAYRVGPGDSLNRMLLHIVPIAVLAIALGASGQRRRWRSARRASAPT